ncbi:hypothetical protein [Myxococcus hansupus]|uniref:hypothetical protein n=1 Tax=Pseudomyxococcus hansupus TaxID=1297742 RepID=UPI000676A194|nr:hypothetical protein [Myxococcus hansupus]
MAQRTPRLGASKALAYRDVSTAKPANSGMAVRWSPRTGASMTSAASVVSRRAVLVRTPPASSSAAASEGDSRAASAQAAKG